MYDQSILLSDSVSGTISTSRQGSMYMRSRSLHRFCLDIWGCEYLACNIEGYVATFLIRTPAQIDGPALTHALTQLSRPPAACLRQTMTCASLARQIYAKQLYTLQLGLPQWHPEVEVKLGDVGFFLGGIGGEFFRLHNVFNDAENQSRGVPDGYEPLALPPHLLINTSCERNAQTLSSVSVRNLKNEIDTG